MGWVEARRDFSGVCLKHQVGVAKSSSPTNAYGRWGGKVQSSDPKKAPKACWVKLQGNTRPLVYSLFTLHISLMATSLKVFQVLALRNWTPKCGLTTVTFRKQSRVNSSCLKCLYSHSPGLEEDASLSHTVEFSSRCKAALCRMNAQTQLWGTDCAATFRHKQTRNKTKQNRVPGNRFRTGLPCSTDLNSSGYQCLKHHYGHRP